MSGQTQKGPAVATPKISVVDITELLAQRSTFDVGIRGELQGIAGAFAKYGGFLVFPALLAAQYYPSWQKPILYGLFLAMAPVLVGIIIIIRSAWPKRDWSNRTIEGFNSPVTAAQIESKLADFRKSFRERFRETPRPYLAWIYRISLFLVPAGLWLVWKYANRFPQSSDGSGLLVFGFIANGLVAEIVLYLEHASAKGSVSDGKPVRGARAIRALTLFVPLLLLWLPLEAFRSGVISDFVLSSGKAGDIKASEGIPLFGFFFGLAGCLWFWLLTLGGDLTTEELTAKYTGSQITFLRSFRDEELAVAFDVASARYDPGWQVTRLEPVIIGPLRAYGRAVALSGRERTVSTIGAARLKLSDNGWQAVAERWIEESMMIVLLIGYTASLEWELSTIIRRKKVTYLLLVLPGEMYFKGFLMGADKDERWSAVRKCFMETEWRDALNELDPSDISFVYFQEGGKVTAIRPAQARDSDYRVALPLAFYGMFCDKRAI